MSRMRVGIALSLIAGTLAVAGPSVASPVARAGVGVVDATWHVGASAGQYASERFCDITVIADFDPEALAEECDPATMLTTLQKFDVGNHQTRRAPSYGIQSRLSVRALVVEGPDPADSSKVNRVAILKNDLYIPQDLLWRRTVQILEDKDLMRRLAGEPEMGIGRTNFTMAVSHNHSSPFYSSTGWGVWAFQDVFDIRFFEYYAQRQALAVEKAFESMVPVRMGASVSHFDQTHRHSFGPAVADDGTPAGYPRSEANHDMMVLRFDDVSNPAAPKPLAILMNYALHPESLDGNNIITGDYIAPMERFVGEETGATLIFTQGDVGTAEPERGEYHHPSVRAEYSHREYAQAEAGARLMANSVIDTWSDISAGTPETPGRFVGFQEGFAVKAFDRFFPGPVSHPYPGVSSCRTDRALDGNPQAPIIGLPDCEGPGTSFDDLPFDPGIDTDTFEAAGIPIPENYSALSYTGLEEDLGVHLQAVKMGDVLVTVCSCEQWKDQGLNIKTRTDRPQGNEWWGFDWSLGYSYTGPGITQPSYAPCSQNTDDTWNCPNPQNPSAMLPPITDHEFKRMRAQVNNDAAGWNNLDYVAWAESEPVDTTQIKGNFTHGELPSSLGYGLTMTIAMANDYNGYLASYREYQNRDHYRKALTGFGPHSEDYFATRLVQAGGWLNGGPDVPAEELDPKETADIANNDARARALGEIGSTYIAALEAVLPADGGPAEITEQPAATVQRFAAAFMAWNGGSNYTDDPNVRVERLVNGVWQPFDDMSGEVVATLEFPTLPDDVPAFLIGDLKYQWTATWEVFSSRLNGVPSTPLGTYRFVVDGLRRDATCDVVVSACPYTLVSNEFEVTRWGGVTIPSIRVEPDGRVSFTVGPVNTVTATGLHNNTPVTTSIGPIDYPDSYDARAEFIVNQRHYDGNPADPANLQWYCLQCSFRPWADTGRVTSAVVAIDRGGDGSFDEFSPAALGPGGRWYTTAALNSGDRAQVLPGGIVSEHGETNGSPSSGVTAP